MITFHKEHNCQDCDTMSEEYVVEVERKSMDTKSTYDDLNESIKETESMLQEIEGEEQVRF